MSWVEGLDPAKQVAVVSAALLAAKVITAIDDEVGDEDLHGGET